MKDGSVVVDLAAERGGNCEGCVPDDVTVKSGVTIVGYTNLACRMPVVSSEFFAMNLYHLLDELGGAEGWTVDLENEITRGAIVLNKGDMLWPAPRKAPPPPPKETEVPAEAEQALQRRQMKAQGMVSNYIGLVLAAIFAAVGLVDKKNSSNISLSLFWPVLLVGK